jgi:hypothetical protein
LEPARLDQPGTTAQVDDGKDVQRDGPTKIAHPEEIETPLHFIDVQDRRDHRGTGETIATGLKESPETLQGIIEGPRTTEISEKSPDGSEEVDSRICSVLIGNEPVNSRNNSQASPERRPEHQADRGEILSKMDAMDHLREEPVKGIRLPIEPVREAIIKWNNWEMQAFFRESTLETDIRNRVKEAWGLKKKFVYLIVNGHGSGYAPQSWPIISSIRMVVKA